MSYLRSAALGCALCLAASISGFAQTPAGPVTHSFQGDNRTWTQNPRLHAVWELLRIACVHGCDKADPAAFERDAITEMRAMAPTVGMTPDAMADHVKAIPRQLLKIGQEDPAILTDYDKFIVALVGPA